MSTGPPAAQGLRLRIRGVVQGVGFRPWVYRLAHELGLRGAVNNGTGGVRIDAWAAPDVLERFTARLRTELPPAARIDELHAEPLEGEPPGDFTIAESDATGARRFSIPADLATCSACLAELNDAADRRHRYPFINCTHCGPRFTIVRAVPYDRPATTMARFELCPDCRREYETVTDRRFHAEPIACPVCGPQLTLSGPDGTPIPSADPLGDAAQALRNGRIVAVKGLGGFHLACDATDPAAVRELRRRKRREEKPFAVMVPDLEEAARHAVLEPAARGLMESVQRPIVLVPGRPGSPLAPEVAPDSARVGLFLPYTPLHHLLIGEAGRPLVMTSGNLSNEPIAFRDDEAVERLGGIADLFLTHDREIESRTDDSVAMVLAGRAVLTRRSRGYVPQGVRLGRAFAEPVLALGGDLKNAFCLGVGDTAYLGPHIGDLENIETYDALADAVERMERFLGVHARVVAHDLHPGYLSTRFAHERGADRLIGVQHHHAHVASLMAEHGLDGPVLGLAWDGTGYGTDGEAWGSEMLVATAGGYERWATFRALRLPGGEAAIRQVWRLGLAALWDAFDGDLTGVPRLPLLEGIGADQVRVIQRMLEQDVSCPRARGVGRWFDALGALGLGRHRASFEGQVAMAWEQAAGSTIGEPYDWRWDDAALPFELDLRPTVRGAVADLAAGRPPDLVSARFHATLTAAALDAITRIRERAGDLPVLLTGGSFQNARLTESLTRALLERDLLHYLHECVPPTDGGLALGQAVVANTQLG